MRFQFKIKIDGVTKPPVWRRISVPADITFKTFNDAILMAFRWGGYHLWQFTPKGYGSFPDIAIPSEYDFESPAKDARLTKITEFFKESGDSMKYIYDFGDDWVHTVLLEDISEEDGDEFILIQAKGMTPPEDCGGVYGYERLKEAMANPKYKERRNYMEWLGMENDEIFDPSYAGIKPGPLDLDSKWFE